MTKQVFKQQFYYNLSWNYYGISLSMFSNIVKVLGVDSEFCNVEALVTGIVDNWPETLMKHRRIFTVVLCFFMFCAGIPMCTEVRT